MGRYRNHVYRVLNYFAVLRGSHLPVPLSVQVAAAFHDLGIWTNDTLDYLIPSMVQAVAHLRAHGLDDLAPEVEALIWEHHKLSAYHGSHEDTVEIYRKADQIDVSRGLIRHGLPRELVRRLHATFPTLGFHRMLARLAVRQFVRSPLRPLPMIHL